MTHKFKVSCLLLASLVCCSPLLMGDALAKPKKGTASSKKKPPTVAPSVDQDLTNVAELFVEKGELASALEIYDELRRDNPENLDLLDTSLDLCRKIPACKPRLPTFLDEFEAFIDRNPESAAARQLLLDYAQELKDMKRARLAIVKIVKAAPKTPKGWLLLVDYHEERRSLRAVDALLLELTTRFPRSPEVWLRVADRELATNDLKGARAALKTTSQLLKPTDQLLQTRLMAYERELDQIIEGIHKDYRQDTRWADLEDDFAHSTYP